MIPASESTAIYDFGQCRHQGCVLRTRDACLLQIDKTDVFAPNLEEDQPPHVLYPDECWFCGCCADDCPQDAIKMAHPLNQRVAWKRKKTGEHFRIGMKNPPPPKKQTSGGHEVKIEVGLQFLFFYHTSYASEYIIQEEYHGRTIKNESCRAMRVNPAEESIARRAYGSSTFQGRRNSFRSECGCGHTKKGSAFDRSKSF
jgi:NAD-dependent dihydropyrimidine dehydrogenase PreA subunit